MKCFRCQAENLDEARFCEDCGAGLERKCPSCGQAVSSGRRFCRSCGVTLTAEGAVYDSGLEQMLAAEALGYTSVWIAEHHFNDYGLCPSPPVLASFVAARTTTLRLGMGVSLLPLHHPVDLAEELAVLDVVSGGRLDVGIGRGGTLQDYQTFQSDRGDSRARVVA